MRILGLDPGIARERFRRFDAGTVPTGKHTRERRTFHRVIGGCTSSVEIDIGNIGRRKRGLGKRCTHRRLGTVAFWVGCRGVIGVA